MKAIMALEYMIKDNEDVIKTIKKQLASHESGENKLSFMGKASAETNLEEAQQELIEHKAKLEELLSQDITELEEKEKIRDAIVKKNHIHYQKVRLRRDVTKDNDEVIEAMLILDELDQDTYIEDDELLEIASKSISMNLTIHVDLEKKFQEIRKDFEDAITHIDNEHLKDLNLLNIRVVICTLHLHVLHSNILENIEEDNLPAFRGFPKFEDWWIRELWTNHHAYYALFKWKGIISNQCITHDQKRAWEMIFSNWISVKKVISDKQSSGYHYNYAFDSMLFKYAEIEEELSTENLQSMSELTQKIISKEDFSVVSPHQNIITDYVVFKRDQIDYNDE